MIHFSKTVLVLLVFINAYSLSSYADYLKDLPSGFFTEYDLKSDGTLVRRKDKQVAKEVFNKSDKYGTLEWSVKSLPCAQNKAFNCVGIYTQINSKIQGNQMNPLASAVNTSGFTMYKVNPNNGEQNSVIKCNSKFIQNVTRDEAKLSNCVEYSKSICKNWTDFVNKNSNEVRSVVAKIEECTDVMKSVDKINVNLRNIFQGEIKQSEKDISESFDAATHPDRFVVISAKAEFSQDKLSPHVSAYQTMFERTEDCIKYEDFFVKGYSGTSSSRKVSSDSDLSSTSKSRRSGSGAGAGGSKK